MVEKRFIKYKRNEDGTTEVLSDEVLEVEEPPKSDLELRVEELEKKTGISGDRL